MPSGTAHATLPWSWYSDPQTLPREQERIFRHAWQYVGPVEQAALAGEYFSTRIGDVPVLVVRDRDERLRAFLNVCRHRGAVLFEGAAAARRCNAITTPGRTTSRVACEPHRALSGSPGCRRTGSASSSCTSRPGARSSSSTPTRTPLPLSTHSARCPSTWPPAGSTSSRSDSSAAPTSRSRATGRLRSRTTSSATTARSRTRASAPSSTSGRTPTGWRRTRSASNQFGPTKGEGGPVEGQFHWFWPVTKLYALPGPQNLVAGPLIPLEPGRTTGWFDYFFSEDVSEAKAEELIAFDDQVGREDRRLVESVQRGAGSGLLDGGQLLPQSEQLLAHFQELVREALA